MSDTFTSHPKTGAKSSIGTTAVQIVAAETSCQSGVLIRADAANTDKVYIGDGTVTHGTADATDGFPLGAGDMTFVPVTDASLVFAISATSPQRIFWMVQ